MVGRPDQKFCTHIFGGGAEKSWWDAEIVKVKRRVESEGKEEETRGKKDQKENRQINWSKTKKFARSC